MAKKLKVALYIPWIYQKGGVERTFIELITRSRHDWTVFTNHFDRDGTFPEMSSLKIVELKRVSLARTFLDLAKASARFLAQKIPLKNFDLFVVSTAGFAEFVAIRNHSIPTVAFCHTPLRVIHDPIIRERYLADNKKKKHAFLAFEKAYKAAERLSWRFFKLAVVGSKEVFNRLRIAGIFEKEKTEFLYRGVDLEECKPGKSGGYFLLPGRISWTKNVELGIAAFIEMVKTNPKLRKFRLIVAGGVDEKSKGYFRELERKYSGQKGLEFVPNPDDGKLFKLYAGSYCVLFTALNEDWGLVPVEAMAFGKPVIAVNQGGPMESVIDGVTGFLAQPDAPAFAKAMANMASDKKLERRMGVAGRKRAMLFDWNKAAKRMDYLLQKAFDS